MLPDDNASSASQTIFTPRRNNELRFLAISDLHFGSECERVDLVEDAFNYCIKQDIHIILCGGDLIDGTFSRYPQKIKEIPGQIEHFIKHYPSDNRILTFATAGDHDLSALKECGVSLSSILKNYRPDVIVSGWGCSDIAAIDVKNDCILLTHQRARNITDTRSSLILCGHSHISKTTFIDDAMLVTIPALSNIISFMPCVLDITIQFEGGYIVHVVIRQIAIEHELRTANAVVNTVDAKIRRKNPPKAGQNRNVVDKLPE